MTTTSPSNEMVFLSPCRWIPSSHLLPFIFSRAAHRFMLLRLKRMAQRLVIIRARLLKLSSMTQSLPNKRGAGKGGGAVLWRAGRAWPALPDRERWGV